MHCENCGKEITQYSNFCSGCGKKIVKKSNQLSKTDATKKKCSFCNKEINEKATNCCYCGKWLSKAIDKDLNKTHFLSEKEKRELEILENPNVRFSSPSQGMWAILFGSTSKRKRKKRIVKLRTKMRMKESNFDRQKDYKEYYRIKDEEEKRFDRMFQ